MPKTNGQFCTAIIIGGGFESSVFAATLGDFCVSNGVNCWWCAEGGDSGSFCDRGYAGCLNTDQIVIYAGGTVTDSSGNRRRCSSSGFCFENCNWVTNIEYRYIDLIVDVYVMNGDARQVLETLDMYVQPVIMANLIHMARRGVHVVPNILIWPVKVFMVTVTQQIMKTLLIVGWMGEMARFQIQLVNMI